MHAEIIIASVMMTNDMMSAYGPWCPGCGARTVCTREMVPFQDGHEKGAVARLAWSCPGCSKEFEDEELARRNAFARLATAKIRGVACWVVRHAALEGEAVIDESERAA